MLLLTNEQVREAEALIAANGTDYVEMMGKAGEAVAQRLENAWPEAEKIVFFCGRGRNGGDAYACGVSERLDAVEKIFVRLSKKPFDDVVEHFRKQALARGGAKEVFFDEIDFSALIRGRTVLVDALYGIGFRGYLEGDDAECVRLINSAKKPVLSVDIPSGVGEQADPDGLCVRADETVTMIGVKASMVKKPASRSCGRVRTAHIGEDAAALERTVKSRVMTGEDISRLIPPRAENSHKGDMGRVLIAGSSRSMPGAVGLACRGAIGVGAGLVTLAIPDVCLPCAAHYDPQATLIPLDSSATGRFSRNAVRALPKEAQRFDAVALGCGMGVDNTTRELVATMIGSYSGVLILDADALNSIAGDTDVLRGRKGSVILTPHPAEMSRLTGRNVADILFDTKTAAVEFSEKYGVITVLKCENTVTALPDGTYYVNPTGNPSLSRGGAGDLLTGVTAALACRMDPGEAAAAASYIHGAAADRAARIWGENGADILRTASMLPFALKTVLDPAQRG